MTVADLPIMGVMGTLGWDGLTDWQRFRLRVTGRYTAYVINRTAAQCTAILQHARLGEPVPVDRG